MVKQIPSQQIHNCVYQINTKVMLSDISHIQNKAATLDDVPDAFLDWLYTSGFTYVYLLGVWKTGPKSRAAAERVIRNSVPGNDYICSSPFAVMEYAVNPEFGGDEALKRFRGKLRDREILLFLDFVPNHVSLDHEWAHDPKCECLMPGNDDLKNKEHQNYFVVEKDGRKGIFAHGRDPHFDGWDDTAQLNYFHNSTREAAIKVLKYISNLCDGVRCDMAMLLIKEVMNRTWRDRYLKATGQNPPDLPEVWETIIPKILEVNKDFKFIAEVYWNLEGELMRQGFHFCYDKTLYDHLKFDNVADIQNMLRQASVSFQQKCVRFLENHDEDRAVKEFPDMARHKAATVLAFTSPGFKFFHMGQFEGRRERIPMQRCKNTHEGPNGEIMGMYQRLLNVLKMPAFSSGTFEYIPAHSSHDGATDHHPIVAYAYLCENTSNPAVLVVVNYSCNAATGRIRLPTKLISHTHRVSAYFTDALKLKHTHTLALCDMYGCTDTYARSVDECVFPGVWFHMQPWQCHVFQVIGV